MIAEIFGAILDDIDAQENDIDMVFVPGGSGEGAQIANDLLSLEVEEMNLDLKLPQEVLVTVEDCGEANAFYDLGSVEIIFCTEFVGHLGELYDNYWRE